jgi:nucleotide-binding universal stress UspA family protein
VPQPKEIDEGDTMVTIKRILCPVDFSELSKHAVGHARAIAAWYEAHVTILHVVSPPPSIPPGVALVVPPPAPPQDLSEDVRRFFAMNGVVTEGSAAKEIVRTAAQLPVDLLVMGTHGRGGFERLFLGSVTEKVLRSTDVPVLTVPPPVEQVGTVAYKTILCPVEFSDPSIRGLEYALALAQENDARLIVLHVIEDAAVALALPEGSSLTVSEYRRQLEADACAQLEAVVPADARVWCTPDERVSSGKAYRVILQLAEAEHAEILVMGVHGKGALNRRFFGSTTNHVIREARCPVLTLRG